MKRGISTLEYAVLIIILALSAVAMSTYIKRGFAGRWRNVGDTFGYGRQYEPGVTTAVKCGDGACNGTETCGTCPADCGTCCGNGICDTGEDCASCPADCGQCCGNGACDFGETCQTCPVDCGGPCCGNGTCDTGEDCGSCPADCGACLTCGDGSCNGGETCSTCPADCGACCGNGTCDAGETCASCPQDNCCICVDHEFGQEDGEIGSCFLANTQITLSNGSLKSIEKIKPGDMLLSFDEKTGKEVIVKVVKTFTHTTDEYLILNEKIKVTANHLFYSDGKWVGIGKLQNDKNLLNINLKKAPIKEIKEVRAKNTAVYNLEVDTYHNYFADGYLVHNKPPCQPSDCHFQLCGGSDSHWNNWCKLSCCGDGVCNYAETFSTCPGDCQCGNGICDTGEDCASCPADCGQCCGNGACDFGETCVTCPGDCRQTPCCGNLTCETGENCYTCSYDCGECPTYCGNSVCDMDQGKTEWCNCSTQGAPASCTSCGDCCPVPSCTYNLQSCPNCCQCNYGPPYYGGCSSSWCRQYSYGNCILDFPNFCQGKPARNCGPAGICYWGYSTGAWRCLPYGY